MASRGRSLLGFRPGRVVAVARQDLASELKGRQGLVLPAVIAGLLLPASAVPSPMRSVATDFASERVVVTGDVPEQVRDLPDVAERSRFRLRFEQEDDVLLVHGPLIPAGIREALDGAGPAVDLHIVYRGYVFPGRTLLLSLITASTLTGAVSQSIGGERSRKTLVVLLAAAISRVEIVLGKWLAWGGVGAGASLLAALVAIAVGNVEPGLWLIPLPWVPLCTVAVGLWLVRRADDVMAGSATTLRVLPAALSLCGVTAWLLGDSVSPWLGACVPLGGALIAAGDTWTGIGPVLVATGSTVGLTVAALAGTIRDLEESSDRAPPERALGLAALVAALGAMTWWMAVAGPELWRLAGNPRVTEALELRDGVIAGAVMLGLFSVIRAARVSGPVLRDLGLSAPRWRDLAEGVVGAAVLAVGAALIARIPPLSATPVAERLADALQPAWAGFGVAAALIVVDEVLFRGWLPRVAGPVLATIAWVVVRSPLDPLNGLLIGGVCAALAARSGSAWTSMVARLGWLLVALAAG